MMLRRAQTMALLAFTIGLMVPGCDDGDDGDDTVGDTDTDGPGSSSAGPTSESAGTMGSVGTSSGASDSAADSSSTGSSEPVDMCERPYQCNPATKVFDDLEREYILEECDPNTGEWTEVHDCSDMGCTCKDTAEYAECSWGGEVCTGIRYEW